MPANPRKPKSDALTVPKLINNKRNYSKRNLWAAQWECILKGMKNIAEVRKYLQILQELNAFQTQSKKYLNQCFPGL